MHTEKTLPPQPLIAAMPQQKPFTTTRDSIPPLFAYTEHSDESGESVIVTLLNSYCCIMGSGILALAFNVHNVSIVLFFTSVLLLAFMLLGSAYIITRVVKQTQSASISGLFAATVCCAVDSIDLRLWIHLSSSRFNETYRVVKGITETIFTINCWILMLIEVKILADTLPSLAQQLLFLVSPSIIPDRGSPLWYALPSLLLIYLTMKKQMEEMLWTSIIGLSAMCFLLIVMIAKLVIHSPSEVAPLSEEHWFVFDASTRGFWGSMMTIFCAFTFHAVIPIYFYELRRRSVRRMMTAISSAFCISTFMYLAVGIIGSLTFGPRIGSHEVGGNLLNAYSDDDLLATLMRAGIACQLVCSFPLLSILVRRSLHNSLTAIGMLSASDSPSIYVRAAEATFCIFITTVVSYCFHGIEFLAGPITGVTGSFFGFTLPGFCGMCLWRPRQTLRHVSLLSPVLQPGQQSSFDEPRVIYFVLSFLLSFIGMCAIATGVFLCILGFTA